MIKYLIGCLIILLCGCKTGVTQKEGDYYAMKRKEMVENQIIARGIKDKKVLNAMYKVERHKFVPEELVNQAYDDNPLPIGEGQTISQPYIVAIMTELCELEGDEKVLEIGTGSGYQAAILAEIVKEVYTIEIIKSLAESAEKRLKELGYKNIKVKCGDGFLGWEENAPYDAIIVTCAPSEIPKPLLEQLKEGGRLVIPVGDFYQELKRVKKVKGNFKEESIIPVRFVPMTGDGVKKKNTLGK
jgi:protein-L-isoaspartate(D-aspartate) O-methyltransferase